MEEIKKTIIDSETFKDESLKLIQANIKIHDANVLLRSDPPRPDEAATNIIKVFRILIRLVDSILEKMILNYKLDKEIIDAIFEDGGKDEHNSSIGNNKAESNDAGGS